MLSQSYYSQTSGGKILEKALITQDDGSHFTKDATVNRTDVMSDGLLEPSRRIRRDCCAWKCSKIGLGGDSSGSIDSGP